MQRMLVVGGCGAIGRLIVDEMKDSYEIVTAGRSNGDHHVDISDASSIDAMFSATSNFDVLVCAAENSVFANVVKLTEDKLRIGVEHTSSLARSTWLAWLCRTSTMVGSSR